MACAGRGRGRGLLQSVMTEGNKQLQLGHSGSCCGAPFPLSLSLSAAAVVVCTLEPRRMTVRKHQMAAGSRRSKQWTTTTGDDGVVCNCCQSCCLAAVHDRVWFIFFGLLVWTKHRYTSANWSLSAAPAALPVAALHWSSSSGSFNTLT